MDITYENAPGGIEDVRDRIIHDLEAERDQLRSDIKWLKDKADGDPYCLECGSHIEQQYHTADCVFAERDRLLRAGYVLAMQVIQGEGRVDWDEEVDAAIDTFLPKRHSEAPSD